MEIDMQIGYWQGAEKHKKQQEAARSIKKQHPQEAISSSLQLQAAYMQHMQQIIVVAPLKENIRQERVGCMRHNTATAHVCCRMRHDDNDHARHTCTTSHGNANATATWSAASACPHRVQAYKNDSKLLELIGSFA
ncbi:hypothetical protein BU15DRAFT_66047 [Melanogaster broomeanus]|nr:hypothetical protein BU15DRAFT_66047 [Melanogaster broomeanus]